MSANKVGTSKNYHSHVNLKSSGKNLLSVEGAYDGRTVLGPLKSQNPSPLIAGSRSKMENNFIKISTRNSFSHRIKQFQKNKVTDTKQPKYKVQRMQKRSLRVTGEDWDRSGSAPLHTDQSGHQITDQTQHSAREKQKWVDEVLRAVVQRSKPVYDFTLPIYPGNGSDAGAYSPVGGGAGGPLSPAVRSSQNSSIFCPNEINSVLQYVKTPIFDKNKALRERARHDLEAAYRVSNGCFVKNCDRYGGTLNRSNDSISPKDRVNMQGFAAANEQQAENVAAAPQHDEISRPAFQRHRNFILTAFQEYSSVKTKLQQQRLDRDRLYHRNALFLFQTRKSFAHDVEKINGLAAPVPNIVPTKRRNQNKYDYTENFHHKGSSKNHTTPQAGKILPKNFKDNSYYRGVGGNKNNSKTSEQSPSIENQQRTFFTPQHLLNMGGASVYEKKVALVTYFIAQGTPLAERRSTFKQLLVEYHPDHVSHTQQLQQQLQTNTVTTNNSTNGNMQNHHLYTPYQGFVQAQQLQQSVAAQPSQAQNTPDKRELRDIFSYLMNMKAIFLQEGKAIRNQKIADSQFEQTL